MYTGGREEMIKKYRIRVNEKEYMVEVEEMEEEGGAIEKEEYENLKEKRTTTTERRILSKQETTVVKEKIVFAPMPAKITKINCKEGKRVKKGDLLIVIEAMKMENEILSPLDGVVKEVCVVEGMNVSSEEKLVVFE